MQQHEFVFVHNPTQAKVSDHDISILSFGAEK
jgi:hypothetical protein